MYLTKRLMYRVKKKKYSYIFILMTLLKVLLTTPHWFCTFNIWLRLFLPLSQITVGLWMPCSGPGTPCCCCCCCWWCCCFSNTIRVSCDTSRMTSKRYNSYFKREGQICMYLCICDNPKFMSTILNFTCCIIRIMVSVLQLQIHFIPNAQFQVTRFI